MYKRQVYLIGKVGSGKTSLLKTIYGELDIQSGEAEVDVYKRQGQMEGRPDKKPVRRQLGSGLGLGFGKERHYRSTANFRGKRGRHSLSLIHI